jgi:hypothetical protein
MPLKKHICCTFFWIFSFSSAFAQSNWGSEEQQAAERNRALTLDSIVRSDLSKQVSSFSAGDTTSLPIGLVKQIGEVKYIICIDSARFTPQGAFFSVYMALDFPNSTKKVAFAAKNIQFNPKGVMASQGAKLMLISEEFINLGPNLQVNFKNNGQNFIEFDCNGYKQTSLSLDFIFNSDILVNANDPNQALKASMDLLIQDLSNILFAVPYMDPFKVKGADDFVFHLQNIIIDRSEDLNPNGLVLPSNIQQTLIGGAESWKGFYAGLVKIVLPEKLSAHNEPTEIYAQNVFIDDAGFTGTIGANNVLALGNGDASGWGFSIDNFSISFLCNNLSAGSMSGEMSVPSMDNNAFQYAASISQNNNTEIIDYYFSISPASSISLSAFNSTLSVHESSQFSVQTVNNRFKPSAILNGSWTLGDINSKARFNGISFQNLTLITESPYISNGIFALSSNNPNPNNDDANLVGFSIQLNQLALNFNSLGNIGLYVNAGLNLGSENNSFSVEGGFIIVSKFGENADGQQRLLYDKITISDIIIDVNTTPFDLYGVVSIKNNDPVFGDLFFGSIQFQINSIMPSPAMFAAGFGKKPTHKYWYVDAAVPVNIPIAGVVTLTSLYGGASNGVESTLTTPQFLERVKGNIELAPPIPFVPNENAGLAFRAGVAYKGATEKLYHGEALLQVLFNANGGFASISFDGSFYMMIKREQRDDADSPQVSAMMAMNYNNNAQVFSAQIDGNVYVPSVLTGSLNINLLISPDNWYFWLNRPSHRANLNLANVAMVSTYLMVGTQVDPLPPPPSYVTNLVGFGGLNNINYEAIGNGSGFVTGMAFNSAVDAEFPQNTNWRGYVNVAVGAGFDLMLMNLNENTKCAGSSKPVGVNSYYCMGQVYAYLNGSIGAKKYKDNQLKNTYSVGSLAVAALLQGKLPKPTYVFGAVGVNVSILGIVNFTFDAEVELGNDCVFVTN